MRESQEKTRRYLHISNSGEVFPAARSSSIVEFAYPPPLLLVDVFNMGFDVPLLLEPLAAQGTGKGSLVVVSAFVCLSDCLSYVDWSRRCETPF